MFYPADADAILCIPLGSIDEDFWAWQPEHHGMYSVKSTYNLLAEDRRQAQMEHYASSSDHQEYWEKVWKLKVSSKVNFSSGEYFLNSYQPVKFSTEDTLNSLLTAKFVVQNRSPFTMFWWSALSLSNSGIF